MLTLIDKFDAYEQKACERCECNVYKSENRRIIKCAKSVDDADESDAADTMSSRQNLKSTPFTL